MKLFKAAISRKDFESLGEKERMFLVQAFRLLNDINILLKTTAVSNKLYENLVERKAQNSQTLFFLTLLTGKLYDGWRLLEDLYRNKLSKKYNHLLDQTTQELFSKLENYFWDKKQNKRKFNVIYKVRNWVASHYDYTNVDTRIESMPQGEDFEIFLTNFQGNCFFYTPNLLVLNAIAGFIGISDEEQAVATYFDEVFCVTGRLIAFLQPCLAQILTNTIRLHPEEIDIPDPVAIQDIRLPFFVGKKQSALNHQRWYVPLIDDPIPPGDRER